MVSEMVRPAVVSFLDEMLREREVVRRVEEVLVKSDSKIIGKTIADSKVTEVKDALLIGFKRSVAKGYEFKPPLDTELQENDVLFFITTPDGLNELEKLVGGH